MKLRFFRAAVFAVLLFHSFVTATGQAGRELARASILAAGPEWGRNYEKYVPPDALVDGLKARRSMISRVEVYLGTWCSDSCENVPRFIKIMDLLSAAWPVQYFDVAEKESGGTSFFIEELHVDRVPTFIFYRDGREIGRIVEKPKVGMIEDVLEILLRR